MKKVTTTYMYGDKLLITKNEEFKDHYSIHEWGEPCSGILKHWGTKKELINELEEVIDALKELSEPDETEWEARERLGEPPFNNLKL